MSSRSRIALVCAGLLTLAGCAGTPSDADSPTAASTSVNSATTSAEPLRADDAPDMPTLVAKSTAIVIGTAMSSKIRDPREATSTGEDTATGDGPTSGDSTTDTSASTTPTNEETAPASPETWTRVSIERVIKGDVRGDIEVAQIGSADGQVEVGAPLLKLDETYLLFLSEGELDGYVLTGRTTAYKKRDETFFRTGHSQVGDHLPTTIPVEGAVELIRANSAPSPS